MNFFIFSGCWNDLWKNLMDGRAYVFENFRINYFYSSVFFFLLVLFMREIFVYILMNGFCYNFLWMEIFKGIEGLLGGSENLLFFLYFSLEEISLSSINPQQKMKAKSFSLTDSKDVGREWGRKPFQWFFKRVTTIRPLSNCFWYFLRSF